MAQHTHEIRGIPLWLLRDYLIDLGGVVQPDGTVLGAGWRGQLTRLADFQLGSLRVGQVQIDLSGDAAALAALGHALHFKLLRAGG